MFPFSSTEGFLKPTKTLLRMNFLKEFNSIFCFFIVSLFIEGFEPPKEIYDRVVARGPGGAGVRDPGPVRVIERCRIGMPEPETEVVIYLADS